MGVLLWFFEIHSNDNRAPLIEADSGGMSAAEARRFKDLFYSARGRLIPSGAPQLELRITPLDYISGFSFSYSSTIAAFARKGFLIECPSAMSDGAAWRNNYANVLAEAMGNLVRGAG